MADELSGFGLYLQRQDYQERTVALYRSYVSRYLEKHQNYLQINGLQIGQYVHGLTSELALATRHNHLSALQRFYDYLQQTGQRSDHPCRQLKLRRQKPPPIQIQDLLTSAELEKILHAPTYDKRLVNRNQVIRGLLIYQAAASIELCQLKTIAIDLDNGTIDLPGGQLIRPRTLELKAKQIKPLFAYMKYDRPRFIHQNPDQTILIVSTKGQALHRVNLADQIRKQQYLIPEKKISPKIIRQSVIANKLKNHGAEVLVVQAFAGHQRAATTQRYQEGLAEQLQQAIEKYHPLK